MTFHNSASVSNEEFTKYAAARTKQRHAATCIEAAILSADLQADAEKVDYAEPIEPSKRSVLELIMNGAMNIRRLLTVFATLFLLSSSLFAADISGTWNANVNLGGQGGSPTFTLKQDGTKLTGTYSGALGEAPLHGTITDVDVSFDFEFQGATIHYAGKLDANGTKITGTCDYPQLGSGTFTATKAEPAKSH